MALSAITPYFTKLKVEKNYVSVLIAMFKNLACYPVDDMDRHVIEVAPMTVTCTIAWIT
jgi:hypothetical protein